MRYAILAILLASCGDEPLDKKALYESETKADVLNAEASAYCHLCNYHDDVCDLFTYFVGGNTPREVETDHGGLKYTRETICTEEQSYRGLTPP